MSTIFKLWQAIKIAHAGKYTHLHYEMQGQLFNWNPECDLVWLKYVKAHQLIRDHIYLEWFLKRMSII